MKTVLSYCSARVFSAGLLPMVAMRPCQSGAAVNDNTLSIQMRLGYVAPKAP
jgi:hypothetical protein